MSFIAVDNVRYSLPDASGNCSVIGIVDYSTIATVPIVIQPTVTNGAQVGTVTTLGSNIFNNRTFFSISIPSTIKSFLSSCFNGTTIGTMIIANCSPTFFGTYSFYITMITNLDTDSQSLINPNNPGQHLRSVIIRESIKTITSGAYSGSSNLTSVTIIGNSITSILSNAFLNCSSLTGIDLPNSVTSLGASAFSNCSKLASVTLGNSLLNIGDSAFENDVSLNSISLPNTLTSIGISSFKGCSGISSITIPSGVITIGATAFQNMTKIPSIDLPSGLTFIGDNAMNGCTALTSVTFGNNLNYIGAGVFAGITIPNLYLPASLTFLGNNSFNLAKITNINIQNCHVTLGTNVFGPPTPSVLETLYCDSSTVFAAWTFTCATLKSIILGGSIINVRTDAYKNATALTSVTLGNSITSIGSSAFSGCSALPSLVLSDNINLIDVNAFYNCTSLTSITLSVNITRISDYTFYGCGNLQSILLPNSITNIGQWAFWNCSKLRDIVIPSSVTNIANNAFNGCSSLTNVTLNSNLLSLGASAFQGDVSLNTIILPDSLTSIANNVFNGCTSLTNVVFGNGIKSIGVSAFQSIGVLQSLTLPASLTSIDTNCFSATQVLNLIVQDISSITLGGNALNFNLNNLQTLEHYSNALYSPYPFGSLSLKSAIIAGSIRRISNGMFQNATTLTSVTLGSAITSIGQYAFSGCSALPNVTIPDSITLIDQYAFQSCTSLTSIPFSSNITGLTAITDFCFSGCNRLTTVTLPNSITSIGINSFAGCSRITSVTLSSNLLSIGTSAFQGDSSLNYIEIPNLVTSVGSSAFLNSGLTNIVLGNSVKSLGVSAFQGIGVLQFLNLPASLTAIDANCFSGTFVVNLTVQDMSGTVIGSNGLSFNLSNLQTLNYFSDFLLNTRNFSFGSTNVKSITLGGSIKRVRNGAYQNATSLTSVTLNNSITSIGSSAFSGCSSLPSMTLSNFITFVDVNAFQNCTSLTNITIGSGLTSISNYFINGCSSLQSLIVPDNILTVGDYAFGSCSRLSNITLSNNLLSLGDYVFQSDVSLNTVIIPNTVTSIGQFAFTGCSNITNVTLGNSIRTIGASAFGARTLQNIVLPATLTSIGANCFQNAVITNLTVQDLSATIGTNGLSLASGLQSLDFKSNQVFLNTTLTSTTLRNLILGGSIRNVRNNAYLGATSLTSITFENSITSIGSSAFSGCSSLPSVIIPNFITFVDANAFQNCTSLTNISIGSGLTAISNYFINGCTNLQSLVVPDTVLTVGNYSFGSCSRLSNITLSANLLSLGEYVFQNDISLNTVIIPNTVTSIGQFAFNGCSNITDVSLSNSLRVIGASAFSNRRLLNVVLPSTLTNIGASCFNSAIITNLTIQDFSATLGATIFTSITGLQNLIINSNVAHQAFNFNLTSLLTAQVGGSITQLKASSFSGCTSLTSVILDQTVTSIGTSAFSGCTAFPNIIMGTNVRVFGDSAFSSARLTNFTIPSSLTHLGNTCFNAATITNLTIDNCYPTTLGTNALSLASGLQNLIIDSSLVLQTYNFNYNTLRNLEVRSNITNIKNNAFQNCTALTNIILNNSVTSIGTSSFSGCSSINSILLGNAINRLGDSAFSSSRLQSFTIPASLTHLGVSCFQDASVTNLTIENCSPTTLGANALRLRNTLNNLIIDSSAIFQAYDFSFNSLQTVEVRSNITNIKNNAFRNCTALTNVNLNNSVTNIGTSSFSGCSSISTFIFGNNVNRLGDSAFSNSRLQSFTIPASLTHLGTSCFQDASVTNLTIENCSPTTLGANALRLRNTLNNLIIDSSAIFQAYDFSFNSLQTVEVRSNITNIKNNAFQNCTALTNVNLNNSVTSIGQYAFFGCNSISTFIFGNNVNKFDDFAFSKTIFSSFTIPSSLTHLGTSCFQDASVTNLTIENCSPSTLGANALKLSNTLNNLIIDSSAIFQAYDFSFNSLQSVAVQSNITNIKDNAFYNCIALTNVNLNNSVTNIGQYAFFGCNSISSFIFGNNVNKFDDFAFSKTIFSSFTIPSSLTYLGASCFQDASVTNLTIENCSPSTLGANALKLSNTLNNLIIDSSAILQAYDFSFNSLQSVEFQSNITNIKDNAFYNCTALTNVNLSNSVTNIGQYAFFGCSTLQNITLPDSIIFIDTNAFQSCSSLTYIFISTNISTLSNYLFADCISLQTITLPYDLLSIQSSVFDGCLNLETIIIPNSVTIIEEAAFNGCVNLQSISLSNSLTSIGSQIFNNCSSLQNIVVPNTVTFIGSAAFNGCSAATNISIGNGISNIESNMFSGCILLESITLGNSITNVGQYAFNNCSSLLNITIPFLDDVSGILVVNDYAFNGCSSLTNVNLPSNLKNINSFIFNDCTSLSALVIPYGTTSISSNAFSGCSNLTSLTMYKNINNISQDAFINCNNYLAGSNTNTVGTIYTDNNYVSNYVNNNNTLNVNLVLTIFFPIITEIALDVNNVILTGSYFIDISNILFNLDINPVSFTINNDTQITVNVNFCFLINTIFISDIYDGSSNFILNSPVYSNVVPSVTLGSYKDYVLSITGKDFLNTSQITLNNNNDLSFNSFIIDSNTKLKIPNLDITDVSSIQVKNEYNNSDTLLISPPLKNILTPVVTSIDNSLNTILINGINFGDVIYVRLNNETESRVFTIIDTTLITVDVSNVFLINKVTVENMYDDIYAFNLVPSQFTNVLPNIDFIDAIEDGQINITGSNFINLKSVIFNDDVSFNFNELINSSYLNSISIVNNSQLIFLFNTLFQINKITLIDWYNNNLSIEFISSLYPNIPPFISDISNSIIGLINITGTNLSNIQTITANSEETPIVITTYTINNNLSITIPVSSIFLLSDILIQDSYNNSYLYTFNIPEYTNLLPTVSSIENNGDFELLITGNHLLNVSLLKLNDFSGNSYFIFPLVDIENTANTFVINNYNSITATISDLIVLDTVDLIDGYNNQINYNLNPDIITDVPPIIEDVSFNLNFYELDISGTSFTYVNNVRFNDISGNNFIDFSDNQIEIKNNNLITVTTPDLFLIESVILFDTSNNSNTFIFNPPIYSNVPPFINNCYIGKNSVVILTGENFTNVSQVLFNDSTESIYSYVIKNNTTIEITPLIKIQLLKVEVINTNNVSSIFNFENSLTVNSPPIVTSVDNAVDGIITVNGINLSNVKYVMVNNAFRILDIIDQSNNIIVFPTNPLTYANGRVKKITLFDNIRNVINVTDIPQYIPTAPICFPAGTPVNTDQGIIEINKINPKIHTIRNKKIQAVSKTVTFEKYIVCIEKDALGLNIPSQKTIISGGHKVFYKKCMVSAKSLVGIVDKVYFKTYKNEPLYNILLETHDKMIVNNLIVETLDPESFMGKFYTSNLTDEEKLNIIMLTKQFAKKYITARKLHNKYSK
jgi:hypothetical protein